MKEKSPPIGFYLSKGDDIMEWAFKEMDENMRGPVTEPVTPSTKLTTNFVAGINDTWLIFLTSLLQASTTVMHYKVTHNIAGELVKTSEETIVPSGVTIETLTDKTITKDTVYKYVVDEIDHYFTKAEGVTKYKLDLDEMGRVLFAPEQDLDAMVPVWVYNDDNSSILHPIVSIDHDLYGIPNVIEVSYTEGNDNIVSIIKNEDPDSPVSVSSRGREILKRVIDPDIHGEVTQETLDRYAETELKKLSTIECTVSYDHGYCPVRVGDCVRLNYTRAGLHNIKAKVISQSIKCETGCTVSEKAIFTSKLWR